MAVSYVIDSRPDHYSKMVSYDCICDSCGEEKWLYSYPEWIDDAVAEFEREHLLCSGHEVDIVTGDVLW